VTHMRKGAERAGCGRRPPGGKLGGDSGGVRGGGGSVTGGDGRGRCFSQDGTIYDVCVPCSGGGGSLCSPQWVFLCLCGNITAQYEHSH